MPSPCAAVGRRVGLHATRINHFGVAVASLQQTTIRVSAANGVERLQTVKPIVLSYGASCIVIALLPSATLIDFRINTRHGRRAHLSKPQRQKTHDYGHVAYRTFPIVCSLEAKFVPRGL